MTFHVPAYDALSCVYAFDDAVTFDQRLDFLCL